MVVCLHAVVSIMLSMMCLHFAVADVAWRCLFHMAMVWVTYHIAALACRLAIVLSCCLWDSVVLMVHPLIAVCFFMTVMVCSWDFFFVLHVVLANADGVPVIFILKQQS